MVGRISELPEVPDVADDDELELRNVSEPALTDAQNQRLKIKKLIDKITQPYIDRLTLGTLTPTNQYDINSGVGSLIPKIGADELTASGLRARTTFLRGDNTFSNMTFSFTVAVSDETTVLATGTNKIKFRMPFAFTVTDIRASLNVAATGGSFTVDVNKEGATIMNSAKLVFSANKKSTFTSSTKPQITTPNLEDDSEIEVDIDNIGTGGVAAGLKIMLIGYLT